MTGLISHGQHVSLIRDHVGDTRVLKTVELVPLRPPEEVPESSPSVRELFRTPVFRTRPAAVAEEVPVGLACEYIEVDHEADDAVRKGHDFALPVLRYLSMHDDSAVFHGYILETDE